MIPENNILLTGSSGFLGKIILKELKLFDVKTLSRKDSNYNYNLAKEIPIFNDSFDLVIHAAGKAHTIPKTQNESQDIYNTNVNGTLNLLKGLSHINHPKYFIFISTVSVYGLTNGILIKESAPLLAIDPYGKSKIDAEFIVKKWCEENNIICTILRLPLIVGYNPPGNLGLMIRAIKSGYYFNIAGGKANKSMVLGSDIAKFILKAAEVGGTFNLTDGTHPTFKDLSVIISTQIGKTYIPNLPFAVANILAKFGDIFGNSFPINSNKLSKIISTLTFDDSKARMDFEWKPNPVSEGFKI